MSTVCFSTVHTFPVYSIYFGDCNLYSVTHEKACYHQDTVPLDASDMPDHGIPPWDALLALITLLLQEGEEVSN